MSDDPRPRRTDTDPVRDLAGGVAHRLNNLLTAIQGNASSVFEELDDERLREELKDALDACREAADFTSNLLAISGRQWAQPRILDLREVVPGLNLGRLVSGQVTFYSNVSARPCLVRVDPDHLDTILRNLVENAREAVGDRGVIELSVDHIPVRNAGGGTTPGWVQIEVADSGCGMDPPTLARACDPFFTTQDNSQGRGLGLPVARGLVRRMGGSMEIESRSGVGTEVRIWIPATDESDHGPRLVF